MPTFNNQIVVGQTAQFTATFTVQNEDGTTTQTTTIPPGITVNWTVTGNGAGGGPVAEVDSRTIASNPVNVTGKAVGPATLTITETDSAGDVETTSTQINVVNEIEGTSIAQTA